MNSQEKILYEKRRGECFRLLAACFYKPQKELFLQEKVFQNLTSLLEQVCPDAAHFSNKMEDSILEYSEEQLSVEYAKLFVGPYELKAPPYGSVYMDKGRRVMGDSTIEVIGMYLEAGLTMDQNFKELPDHIAVELEFMYFLIFEKVNALEKSESHRAHSFHEFQNVFFNKHLRKWVPFFCNNIITNTNNSFYIALANCLSALISQEIKLEDYLGVRREKPCDLLMS